MTTSLEEILQKYFGCKGNAFLKMPHDNGDETKDYFTKNGAKAYQKLCALLNDLDQLGVLEEFNTDSEEIISVLDNIIYEG